MLELVHAFAGYAALVVCALIAAVAYRRRRRKAAPVTWKPTPWDEFRRRVVQATGSETVCQAVRLGDVQELPGGWLTFDGMAHHRDESASAADLELARRDARKRERPSTVQVEFKPEMEMQFNYVDVKPISTGNVYVDSDIVEPFKVGDRVTWNGKERTVTKTWDGGYTQLDGTHAVKATDCTLIEPEPVSPWIGRRLSTGEVVTGYESPGILLSEHRYHSAKFATLHPDDVRVGDLATEAGTGERFPVTRTTPGESEREGGHGIYLGEEHDCLTSAFTFKPAGCA